jgi:hypothetical protein
MGSRLRSEGVCSAMVLDFDTSKHHVLSSKQVNSPDFYWPAVLMLEYKYSKTWL